MTLIHHVVSGNPESTVCLVFISGMLCNQSNWDLQIQYFQDQYQMVTLELPGHGTSSVKPNQQWDVPHLAEDLKLCLLDLNLKKPLVLIAHSASVRIALELNHSLKRDVAGLILIDCGYQTITHPDIRQWSADLRHKGYAKWLTQFFSSKFGPSTQFLRDTMLEHALTLDPNMGEELYLGIKLYDYYTLEKCLRLTKVPVLVLQSSFYANGQTQSNVTEQEVRSEWLDLIKATVTKAQIQLFLQCGHWIMLQQAERCNQAISQFLQYLQTNPAKRAVGKPRVKMVHSETEF